MVDDHWEYQNYHALLRMPYPATSASFIGPREAVIAALMVDGCGDVYSSDDSEHIVMRCSECDARYGDS